MSTGNLSLDILLNEIKTDVGRNRTDSVEKIQERFPALSKKEADDVFRMIQDTFLQSNSNKVVLVATAPPFFSIKAKSTVNTVKDLLNQAHNSILITGYSLSEYFQDSIEMIIKKSQSGVLVKFFVNQIENQKSFEKLLRYKGKFLRIYNYPRIEEDSMSALHAKVISIDSRSTLITSANLSYHGQEGNIELGTLVESNEFARQVEDVFTQLVFKKQFLEV